MKAFVVRRFHVSRCLARVWSSELMPRTRSPAAQAMVIRRWTWPAPAGRFGGRSLGLPLSLYSQLKTSNMLLE